MKFRECIPAAKLVISGMIFAAATADAQQAKLPSTHAKSLSGQSVTVPAANSVTLVIVGFTKASSTADNAWWKQAEPLCRTNSRITCYEAAVLESVPRLVRSMVVGSMKKGVPADHQDSFLTVFENESQWKQAFGYSSPDDAYVALVDGSGNFLWKTHGNASAANGAVISEAMRSAHLGD